MYYAVTSLIIVLSLILISEKSKFYLHMLQVEKYNSVDYREWINKNKKEAYKLTKNKEQVEKPLVFTPRAKRLYFLNLLLSFLVLMIIPLVFFNHRHPSPILGLLIIAFTLYRQQADTLYLSNSIMGPIESNINMGFYKSAQAKIRARKDLKVVGITGSFGKSSTKIVVEEILKPRYKVLNTPEASNTAMGLSKVINDELSDEDQIFIAEMGSKNIGEIKELADLCQPNIGVLTSIGPVHMETFKNIDNIMKTKYELIEELPTDGVAIFNYDNEYIRKLADKTFKEKILFGFEDVEKLDIYADNIVVTEEGSSFNLKDKEGNSVECTSRLLGKHNIYNLLAGVAVAKTLGLSLEEICQRIKGIKPIPHRLSIVDSDQGLIIIDNSYNSNPIGTRAALDVISRFKEGKKIVVTPGMNELGDMEEEANREFGKNMGKTCDYVILIGEENTQAIYDGLMDENFNPDNIILVKNLEEARTHVDRLARAGDIVLFENDPPVDNND